MFSPFLRGSVPRRQRHDRKISLGTSNGTPNASAKPPPRFVLLAELPDEAGILVKNVKNIDAAMWFRLV
jgi:hypothetical protein